MESTELCLSKGETSETWQICVDPSSHLRDLLSHLHTHLLSRSYYITEQHKKVIIYYLPHILIK